MNRAIVEDLPSPVPLGSLLPDIYRRFDENIGLVTSGLDEVIAPVWLVLDCFDAYLDPALAPDDFVELLASWVGLSVDRNWSDEQARRLVMQAVELYRWRGTRRGISALVEAYTGTVPEISDSGGTSASTKSDGLAPGSPVPSVKISLDLPNGDFEGEARVRLTRLIVDSAPAHVAVQVEVRSSPAPEDDVA